MVQITDNGRQITVRMMSKHDMPKVVCVRRREEDGTDTEIWFEARSTSEALAELLGRARGERDRLAANCAALRGALKPFAKAAESCIDEFDGPDRNDTWEHAVGMEVTIGDFRASRQAFEDNPGAALLATIEAGRELAFCEQDYRKRHDLRGGGHMSTGRAWDMMRRHGDKLRQALANLDGQKEGDDR